MSNTKEYFYSFRERKALSLMGNLKHDGQDFYPCWQNDLILFLAKIILLGRDPIKFAAQVCKNSGDHDDSTFEELVYDISKAKG